MRGLKDSSGALLPSSQAFVELRDNLTSSDPDVYLRRALFENIFQILETVCGV